MKSGKTYGMEVNMTVRVHIRNESETLLDGKCGHWLER